MSTTASDKGVLEPSDTFIRRHLGPSDDDIRVMLEAVGAKSLEELVAQTVPAAIRMKKPLELGPARGEHELLAELRAIAADNRVLRSFIGLGYHDCIVPPVIARNVLENPGWYTQYTPYQAEISQGRLEALLNFQTMIADLTGLELAGASLLDEGTAAAEAMAMCFAIAGGHGTKRDRFVVASDCHPQTIAVAQTRGKTLGVRVEVADTSKLALGEDLCGVLLAYPGTDGRIVDWRATIADVKKSGATVAMVADPLALTLFVPPGELGADIAVGSTQRFGVPMGYGGPHAAYIATRPEHARRMPGRIIGVSKDAQGHRAYRMAIQTREQHIKRERATSNICTAQALLAIMAGFYGVWHGPDGIRRIALRVREYTRALGAGLAKGGHEVLTEGPLFDTLRVRPKGATAKDVIAKALSRGANLRDFGDGTVGLTCDETTTRADVSNVLGAFGVTVAAAAVDGLARGAAAAAIPAGLARTTAFMTHVVFNTYHSETDMLRYITKLQGRDLSLAQAMIPLGSCTMKLNATSEMLPVTWPEFGALHPFVPLDQAKGYARLFSDLEKWLAEITGFVAVTLQPNAGSQGEYTGLLVIRAYHDSRGETGRKVCLIPTSAHGTNPASSVVAGFDVVTVACDERGNIDVADLRKKAEAHRADLGALMVTYPSTHGVFEAPIKEMCDIVHAAGGQVYMDGANMNAQVGLCRPADIGADVCHLNLHKTFCIPHGGGGPGMGPIAVAKHLAPFLPGHVVTRPSSAGAQAVGAVASAPWGSPSILPISWVYIALMGGEGLKKATEVAILNANYMAKRLEAHFPVLYTGENGRVAHEFILDCRQFKAAGVEVDDIAKRLMDYGFHSPTMSFPVPGTLMVEPTESEPKSELDRFVDAMIRIREEIRAVEQGKLDRVDNPLKNAPHTLHVLTATEWTHKYPREQGAFPAPYLRDSKFWPAVGRIDNPYGDRNLMCTCPPMEDYASA